MDGGQFRAMVQALHHPLVVVDAQDVLEYCNPAFETLTGQVWQDVPSFTELLRRIVPDDQAQAAAIAGWQDLVRRFEQGEAASQSLSIVTRSGAQRSVICRVLTHDEQRTAMVIEDVTDTRRTQSELRKSRDTLRVALDNTYDAVFIHDVDGRIVDVNQKTLQLYGLARDEALGLNIVDLSSHDSPMDVVARRWQSVMAGESQLFEWRARRPGDDVEFDVEVYLSQISLVDVPFIIANVRDITERKRAEQERFDLQQQLLQAQKMEAIARLAGGVAHDFNNLLTSIIGHADLVLARLEPGSLDYEEVEQILIAGNRAGQLTGQLLAYSRKQVISPRVVDPNAILMRSRRMLERIIGEDVVLEFKPGEAVGTIEIDPAQLDQILMNLAVNSRDAMVGGGWLLIETSNVAMDAADGSMPDALEAGEYVSISVSDTGSGMDAATRRQIFDPFFTTKEPGKGTGLGLATVYGITRQNRGAIKVYSEPGIGTTIKVYFPRTNGEPVHVEHEIQPTPEFAGSETILLVEDEPSVRALATKVLRSLGYEVLSAESGQEGIELARQHRDRIALLLTDVVMPRMDGQEVQRRVTAVIPELKTLFMSGYTADIIAHHGILEQGVHLIAKPFSVAALARRVRAALDS